jgi:hypothetical protein
VRQSGEEDSPMTLPTRRETKSTKP